MIKRLLTFVSGLQESVLLDFRSQNKVKILHKLKTSQNSLHQKFPYKSKQIYLFFYIFELLLKFYVQFYFILNFSNSCNGKNGKNACGN